MKRIPLVIALLGAAVLLAAPPFLKSYGIYLFSYWLVFVIATMGLNLTVGYAGQKSLGHAAFFGIGAYTVAILLKAGVSFWLGLPLAMLGCFVIGLVIGFPALRVQTIYLAFATLGFNTAVWLVLRNEEWLTGGTFGINGIARPSLLGLSLDKPLAFYYFVLAVAVLMALFLWDCCARHGARPSPRCATTRSAPRAWASTSRPTRCCRSRSVRCMRASPARCSHRWCSSSSRRRSPWARRS
jgi:branched-chain amino acid transport system permease protein